MSESTTPMVRLATSQLPITIEVVRYILYRLRSSALIAINDTISTEKPDSRISEGFVLISRV